MRLYLTSYIDDDSDYPRRNAWDGTQADASKRRVALKKEGMRDVETKEADVPTDKQRLLGFLNGEATFNAK